MYKKRIGLMSALLLSAAFSFAAFAAGWEKEGDEYIYIQDDGTRAVNTWVQDNGKWYYFEDHGWMVTGWWPVDGKWYYLRASEEDKGAAVIGQTYQGYTYDENGVYIPAVAPVNDPPDNGHEYYKNITEDKIRESESVAWLEAALILSNPGYDTDYKKVHAAYDAVRKYMGAAPSKEAAEADYRSPAGVFCSGYWTCAGTTRALGRILDYMGYSWEHANPNNDIHQWCIVNMDGQKGYADPQGGVIGYGLHIYHKAVTDAAAAAARPAADGYDPRHPLARLIERWKLSVIPGDPYYRGAYKGAGRMMALLNGQEAYFPDIMDDLQSLECAEKLRAYLNTFDIENATERERAEKLNEYIRDITVDPSCTEEATGHSQFYNFFIHRKVDQYWLYFMDLTSLAEYFGLPAYTIYNGLAIVGSAIRIDGTAYAATGLSGFDLDHSYLEKYARPSWNPREGYSLQIMNWSDGITEIYKPELGAHGLEYTKVQ